MIKKLVIAFLLTGMLVNTNPAKAADSGDVAIAVIGGLFGGVLLSEASRPKVYVQQPPYYYYNPPYPYYNPPPVYYRAPICRTEYYRDSWGYVYSQQVCY